MLDILITTAGSWPYPQKCIESILSAGQPLALAFNGISIDGAMPEGVRILIRDNPASKKDETYDYLISVANEFGPEKVLLYSPDWQGEHGQNLDFLATKTTAEWALAIDSDVEFTDPNWLDFLLSFIRQNPDMQASAEIHADNPKPSEIAPVPGLSYRVPRIWGPRAASWFMLFKPAFVRDHGISFGRRDFKIEGVYEMEFPYPWPKFMRRERGPIQRWTMENGWQLLWAGLYANSITPGSFIQLPEHIRKTFTHHHHKICPFIHKSGGTPNAPTGGERWNEDIPQVIP